MIDSHETVNALVRVYAETCQEKLGPIPSECQKIIDQSLVEGNLLLKANVGTTLVSCLRDGSYQPFFEFALMSV